MIFGVGTDLVSQRRIAASLDRFGTRFMQRILTDREQALLSSRPRNEPRRIRFLSQRFAAKEAFSKALGTGMKQGVAWRDVGVHNEASGKPVLHLSETMAARIRALGIDGMHISLADEGDMTAAVVILERLA